MSRKVVLLFILIFVVTVSLVGCKKTENYNTDTAVAATDTTTTTTSGTDTSATTTTTPTTTTAGSTATTLSDKDKAAMSKFAQGGQMEVTLGQMVSQKAQSPDVKTFADRMVTDHGKANDELKQLASTKGMTLPTDLGEHQKSVDELSKKSGKDLDKSYMNEMVKDHEKDVSEFKKASTEVQDADLKNWVTKTLPTLEEHLRMAKETQKKVK